MKLRLLSPAQRELAETVEFYQAESTKIADDFLNEFNLALRRIEASPKTWRLISTNHRRCLLRRIPFGVIYSIQAGEIVIASVMHLHRHPNSWKANL